MDSRILSFCVVAFVGLAVADDDELVATCKLDKTSGIAGSNVEGDVTFTKDGGNVKIDIDLKGFAGAVGDKHGFHVHETGSVSNMCTGAGGHFNPGNVNHGGPTDSVRHAGDLGNIEEQANGVIKTDLTDSIIKLEGANTIIGRAVVVHSGEDDLGKGGDEGSRTTGNAGARMACCVIEEKTTNAADHVTHSAIFLVTSALVALLTHM